MSVCFSCYCHFFSSPNPEYSVGFTPLPVEVGQLGCKHADVNTSAEAAALFTLNFPLNSRRESNETEANFSGVLLPARAPPHNNVQTPSPGSDRHNCPFVGSALRKPAVYQPAWAPGGAITPSFTPYCKGRGHFGVLICLKRRNISDRFGFPFGFEAISEGSTIHVNTPKCSRRRGR